MTHYRSQRIRLLLRHRQSMVRRNKDLMNAVRGSLKAFGIRTGCGNNTLYAKRVRKAINDPVLQVMTEPLLRAYEDGSRRVARRMSLRGGAVFLPEASISADRYDGSAPSRKGHGVAAAGIEGAVAGYYADLVIRRYPVQQAG